MASILYVEDDERLARLMQRRLERHDFEIDLTFDGEAGIEKVVAGDYDIVIIDYDIPLVNGLQVIQRLEEIYPEHPPLIILTAYNDVDIAVQALKLGAYDYLLKDVAGEYFEKLPRILEQGINFGALHKEKLSAERNQEILIQELDAFAHTVAHDLKHPISTIKNATKLLEETSDDWLDEQHELFGVVYQTSDKIVNIIEGLLLIATVRQKKELYFKKVNCQAILIDVIDRFQAMIQEKNAQITIPESFPSVFGYDVWIEEVFANFISNALKYGGNPPIIQIEAHELIDQGVVRFDIIDNGHGIENASTDNVYKPFIELGTLNTSGDGHGLGLSIVRRIVTRLGGEVGVISEMGEGSTFWFTLPSSPPAS